MSVTPISPDKQASNFNPQKHVEYIITVASGKDLPGVDHHGTTSDPYVVVKCGTNSSQTMCIKKSLNPTWGQIFTFQSDTGQHHITFTVRNKNMIKDVIMGEGLFKFEIMGNETCWEGDVTLHGYHVKSPSTCLHIKVERKNYKTMWGKMQRSISKVQDRAKQVLSDKTCNLARLAFVTAHNHMVSRHLAGNIEVEVTLGYFIVSMEAEIEEAEAESKGTIELVEDTKTNVGPTQTKPTKGMQKTLDTRIIDLLDTIETTTTRVTRDVAVTVKAGVVAGFLILPAPKLEMQVKVMVGVQVKARVGSQTTIAAPALPEKPKSPTPDPEDDKELTDMIYKLATGSE